MGSRSGTHAELFEGPARQEPPLPTPLGARRQAGAAGTHRLPSSSRISEHQALWLSPADKEGTRIHLRLEKEREPAQQARQAQQAQQAQRCSDAPARTTGLVPGCPKASNSCKGQVRNGGARVDGAAASRCEDGTMPANAAE